VALLNDSDRRRGRHETVDVALRFLGLGEARSIVVPADDQGRIRLDALEDCLHEISNYPVIVCLQGWECA
jgi:hypothetical protein